MAQAQRWLAYTDWIPQQHRPQNIEYDRLRIIGDKLQRDGWL